MVPETALAQLAANMWLPGLLNSGLIFIEIWLASCFLSIT